MAESPPRRRARTEEAESQGDSASSGSDGDDAQEKSDGKSDGSDSNGKDVQKQTQGMQVSKDENKRPDTTATLEPLTDASPEQWLGSNTDPDVLLAIPNLGIDHIGIRVKNLKAHVELHAKVLDLVELHVGAQASIEEVDIEINNVRVQAMLKVKLDKVESIVNRVVELLENRPEILTNLTGGLGKGLEGALQGGTSDSDGSGGDDDGGGMQDSIQGTSNVESDDDQKSEDESEDEGESEDDDSGNA